MKYITIVIALISLLLVSCSTQEKGFLEKFEELKSFPFEIKSTGYISEDSTYAFIGEVIRKSDVINASDIVIFNELTDNTYACYRFKIQDDIHGLLIRSPSAQWSSSIKLCTYDGRNNSLMDCLEVAEVFGDDGYEMSKLATLSLDKSYLLEIVKTECLSDLSFENISCRDSVFFYRTDGGSLVPISKKERQINSLMQ